MAEGKVGHRCRKKRRRMAEGRWVIGAERREGEWLKGGG